MRHGCLQAQGELHTAEAYCQRLMDSTSSQVG
jgi:hypothetical protein